MQLFSISFVMLSSFVTWISTCAHLYTFILSTRAVELQKSMTLVAVVNSCLAFSFNEILKCGALNLYFVTYISLMNCVGVVELHLSFLFYLCISSNCFSKVVLQECVFLPFFFFAPSYFCFSFPLISQECVCSLLLEENLVFLYLEREYFEILWELGTIGNRLLLGRCQATEVVMDCSQNS